MNSLSRWWWLFMATASLAAGCILNDLASSIALLLRHLPAGTPTPEVVFAAGAGGGGRATARSNYLSKCATCHGAGGKGDGWTAWLFRLKMGDLTNFSNMQALSDDYIFLIIKQGGANLGKPGMPSWGQELTDQEIRDLTAYIRSLARPPHQQQSTGTGR
jgi:cytochrome c oxidase cbb3-type subunit III